MPHFYRLWVLLCCALLPTLARAQQLATRPHYTATIDSLVAALDKSAVPSGILYDRVMPLAGLHTFSTGGRTDTSSAAHFRQAYLELYTAAYAPTAAAPAFLRRQTDYLLRRQQVPLGLLDTRFELLDTLALDQNLLREQNGLLYDVPGRPRSPFQTRQLLLAAPLTDTTDTQVAFYLDPELLQSTAGRQLSSLLIDFDDQAGSRPCTPGQTIAVTYPAAGPKTLRITAYFSNGTQAQARARLYVRASVASRASLPLTGSITAVTAAVPFQDYVATGRRWYNLHGEGYALTVLHNETSQNEYSASASSYKLRKPVIFIDGFDAKDKRRLLDGSEGEKSLYQQLSDQGILGEFDRQERDLVILNFPKSPRRIANSSGTTTFDVDGGTDYIERNAMVLVQLLNDLKPRLAPGEKFTVLGPSMGGLISRYALAYMEKQQQAGAAVPAGAAPDYWNHNTQLWISLDSPHQGANIPIGDQFFMTYYDGLSDVAAENLEQSINSVAARQMLVHHHLANSEVPRGAPGFRDRFMLALRDNGLPGSYGYPVNLRRIALANGRLDGGIRPDGKTCDDALQLDIFLSKKPTYRRRTFFLGINVTGSFSSANIYFSAGANTRCRAFFGRITLIGSLASGYQLAPWKRGFVSSDQNGSYDLAPGGSYDVQKQLRDKTEQADNRAWYDAVFRTVVEQHCFIPTVSALGFQFQNTSNYQNTSSLPNPYTPLLGRDLTCTGEIPFDAYYGPNSGNTFHVEPDAGGLFFLATQLGTPPPIFTQAPNALCPNGGTGTFQVQGECSRLDASGQPLFPVTYTWTLSGPAVFAGNNGQSIIGTATQQTIRSTGGSGTVTLTITAQRQGFSGSGPVSRTLIVAPASIDVDVYEASPVCEFTPVNLRANPFNLDAASLRWYIKPTSSSTFSLRPEYNGQPDIVVDARKRGTLRAYVTGGSLCTPGQTLTSPTLSVQVEVCSYAVQFYPNPADGYTEARLTSEETSTTAVARAAPAGNWRLQLYDGQGRLRHEASTTTATQRLATHALPAGIYHVVIDYGGKVKRYNLQVRH